jgi:hypothetical protein
MAIINAPDNLTALLVDLYSLVQQARAKGGEYDLESTLPHYWYGVATGYLDCAERLEALLHEENKPFP